MGWRKIPRGTVRWGAAQTEAALRALVTADFGLVRKFEEAFARLIGVRHAIAVSSGKAALALVLRGLEARPAEGVVLASYNVPEVPAVIVGLGLRPRFADIHPRTFNLDLDAAKAAVDKKTRFILVTHLYGHPADLDRAVAMAQERDLILIEDCAQALLARWNERFVGTFGRAAIFSFGLMKNLNTLHGGMVVTNDEDLAGRVRDLLASAPSEPRARIAREVGVALGLALLTSPAVFSLAVYPFLEVVERVAPTLPWRLAKMRPEAWERGALDPGTLTAPMGPAQAACGLVGLGSIEAETRARQSNAQILRQCLAGIDCLTIQDPLSCSQPAWTQFVVRVPSRMEVRRRLLREGIDTTIGYLRACHRIPGFSSDAAPCFTAEVLERENLYLPISPDLSGRDMERIAYALRRALHPTG